MPRLVEMPLGLRVTMRAPLTGPRSAGGGATESLTGFAQTVASPFGLWRWQFSFTAMHKAEARRYRGFITSLHGGANATRVTFRDPDAMSFAEAGLTVTADQARNGMTWSNGMPWSNGAGFRVTYPHVALAATAAQGDDTVELADEFWRDAIGVGDQIGFVPLYLGMHVVTEVIGGGAFRVWPPLRAGLTPANKATLEPVMVMRLESEASAGIARGISAMEAPTITLTEIEDADVRLFYTG